MFRSCILLALLAGLSFNQSLEAQPIPFDVRVLQNGAAFTVPNGAQLDFSADSAGVGSTAQFEIAYRGSTRVEFPTRPRLLGSAAFRLTAPNDFPVTLTPNGTLNARIDFQPTGVGLVLAQFSLTFVEESPQFGEPARVGVIQFDLRGLVPNFSVSYVLETDGNVRPLADGGTIAFEPTQIDADARAVVQILNRGSGSGTVESVSIEGNGFRIFGLPLLPATVEGSDGLQFEVRFSPRTEDQRSGSLRVVMGGNVVVNAELRGDVIQFSYELIEGGTSRAISPQSPVVFPPTPAGQSSSATILVRNIGTANGVISGIAATGGGFGAIDVPFMPATLAPNETVTFTLQFAPPRPADLVGQLRIGSAIFELRGSGLGSDLRYSFSVGGASRAISPGEAILYGPAPVGTRASALFTVRNVGPRDAEIPSIAIGAANGVFHLRGLPRLPLRLEPDQQITFEVEFTPNSETLASAQLLVGTAGFQLAGFGDPPTRLPEHRFTGVSGAVELLTQPAVGLSLQETYPIPIRGILILTPDSGALPDDPSVQFASGGRVVPFIVPANSTEALFEDGSNRVRFQTGSVASTLRISPRFATEAGAEITPAEPLALSLTAASTAPVLRGFIAAVSGPDTIQIAVSGFTPTRALSRMDVTFTPAPGSKLETSSFQIDLNAAGAFWFSSAASVDFGGQFVVTVPFTVETKGPPPNLGIGSISVTISNAVGTSNPVSVVQF